MAELLLRWLNHELELSTRVTDVETDFASGYLLGELLHRLNQQHNLGDFQRSSSADAKIANFCLLEPSLRRLNVSFDATVASAIMNEKKDAAANLLYQIKIATTRLGRAPEVSTKSLERSAIYPLHNRPVKLAKPSYDSETHRQFEHSIRRHARSVAALQSEKDRIKDEADKRRAYLVRMVEQKEILEATKAERLHRAYIHSTFIKEALEETDSPAWRLALQKKNAREHRRAVFLQQLMKKREEVEENLTFSLRRKVKNDLDDFDANGGSTTGDPGAKVPSRKSVGYGLRSLTTALVTASDKKKYSTATLAGSALNERELYRANVMEMESAVGAIKYQRHQREKRKEHYSRRRKRFVQECVYTHSRIGTACVSSILEDVVLRKTNSEKDVGDEMGRILAYKEVVRENRSMRDQEYKNQEELDMLTVVNRDTCCYHSLILRFEDDRDTQVMQWNCVQASVRAADHHLSKQISEAIMKDIVTFMLFIAGKREESMVSRDPAVFLNPETWSDSKIQFANNQNIVNRSTHPTVCEDPSRRELLDSHELEQYLANFLPFHVATGQLSAFRTISNDFLFSGVMDILDDCFVLGEEIKSLRWISRAESQSDGNMKNKAITVLSQPVDSQRKLRILIFGPPFAGKKTQAKLLGASHNLTVLSIHELIHNSIQKASAVGQKAEALLSSGMELPPALYSSLVIESIADIESGQGEHATTDGWIIYDLPATEQHGKSLEERLTGYVDPSLIPSPYDFESPIARGRKKPAFPPTILHGKSGVDLVFHLECPMAAVLERCLGSVEDCATNETSHLVFDPPSDESTVRHRLHHVNPSLSKSELLSLHCLATDDFSPDHKAWYTKFSTLHEPSNSGLTANEVHETISDIVSALQRKKQEQKASELLQQEETEQRLMKSEEERYWRMFAFEAAIDEAKQSVTKIEASIVEAEEAKAKKEELMELRQTLDEAQRQLHNVLTGAKSWAAEEAQSLRPKPISKYSGELVPASAGALAILWDGVEAEYVSSMKSCFSLLRKQRDHVSSRAQTMTRDFCEFVRRPDKKQDIVNQFQKHFNEVVEEMRFDDLTKLELHARVDILQDELGDLVEAKVSESEEELAGMIGDGWTDETCQQVAAIYQTALQAECDRFRVSVQILIDGYYSASPDHALLKPVVDSWQAHQSRLDLVCKIYRDPTNDIPQETTPAPAATGKAAPKGKGKASVPAVVASPSPATSEDALTEALGMSELLAEFGHVLQRCDLLVEAIAPVTSATDSSSMESNPSDICKVNLLNGIRYELSLIVRRVKFLQEATETFRDEISRSMRSIELKLRDVLEDQKNRKQAAVVALIEHIRTAIEAEVALPSVIDISPGFIPRFPTTMHLREDTLIRVDCGRRLLQRPPPDALPVIEEVHPLLLNQRQRADLHEVLTSQSISDAGLLPLCTVIETLSALTTTPDALPPVWRRCPSHVIAEIASDFTTKPFFVDIDALLNAMATRDDLLQKFQEQEAQEQLERQQQRQQQELERQQLRPEDHNASDSVAE